MGGGGEYDVATMAIQELLLVVSVLRLSLSWKVHVFCTLDLASIFLRLLCLCICCGQCLLFTSRNNKHVNAKLRLLHIIVDYVYYLCMPCTEMPQCILVSSQGLSM